VAPPRTWDSRDPDAPGPAQRAESVSRPLIRRSRMVCESARSQIRVLPRFCFVGCKGSALARPLRVWISTPCRRHSLAFARRFGEAGIVGRTRPRGAGSAGARGRRGCPELVVLAREHRRRPTGTTRERGTPAQEKFAGSRVARSHRGGLPLGDPRGVPRLRPPSCASRGCDRHCDSGS
jgi:hypothetical protein